MIPVLLFLIALGVLRYFGQRTAATDKLDTVIGIDFGTTYSCVGVFQNGKVNINANEVGSRATASVVSFGTMGRLIGDAAKHQMTIDPSNTVFAIKRLMGLRFSDPFLKSEVGRLPYKVVNTSDRPSVKVSLKGQTRFFWPEEIAAMIIAQMKTIAEVYLGRSVTNAVITVPAYFNDAQRRSVIDGGTIAGLNVLQILNEPTAAAVAYGLDRLSRNKRRIVVFDFGGGTLDISVLVVTNRLFEVIATNGDTHLGGEDFDERVIRHLTGVYRAKTGKDCSTNLKAMGRLRCEVEKAKHRLSSELQTTITIYNFNDHDDLEEILTRAHFESLIEDLSERILEPLRNVLKDAKLEKHEIDDVVMAGGSTQIPKVRKLVQDFFDGKELSTSVNPNEVVAAGAAIQAGILSGEEGVKGTTLLNVNPLTLGIENVTGEMVPVLPRNSRVPTSMSEPFTTVVDYQVAIEFSVFEGERPMVKDNHFLGSFLLTGIEYGRAGLPSINVTFTIDDNGLLYVSAKDQRTNAFSSITINAQDNRLSASEIEEAIRKAEEMKEADEREGLSHVAKLNLENFLHRAENDFMGICKNGLDWLERHPHEKPEVYNRILREIKGAIPIRKVPKRLMRF
jgi:heat shock protein 5